MNYWTEHCEPARTRPEGSGLKWDVFISYRSLDRVWALALYDMLTQCGYSVFMDEFVLVPGAGLASQLGENLQASASGVLLWSNRARDSKWVKSELDAMTARRSDSDAFPFHFVVASLDGQKPPGLLAGTLYLDFSDYPDGPMGADLVRLTCGLQGKPLGSEAVGRVAEFEARMKEEPARLRAMAKVGQASEIEARIVGDEPAYTTSATLVGVGVDLLVRAKEYERALTALQTGRERFPRSVRLRQLHGLALRRLGRLEEARLELELLHGEGHRDTETLGILAAVHANLWEIHHESGGAREARDALERSRDLYKEAFEKVPSDTYTGINSASKSALLGDLELARELARRVLDRLEERAKDRGGAPADDYWERATEPEALLLLGEEARAVELYHAARVAHREERGSIESTAAQVRRLLGVLDVDAETRAALMEEFDLS